MTGEFQVGHSILVQDLECCRVFLQNAASVQGYIRNGFSLTKVEELCSKCNEIIQNLLKIVLGA